MKTSWINSFLALILTTLVTGCASIVHGPNQAIDFSSQPHGATITIDGKEFGRTPKAIVLRRIGRMKGDFTGKTEYAVKIEMEGFYPYEVKIKREMDGWFLGNIIFNIADFFIAGFEVNIIRDIYLLFRLHIQLAV